MMDCSVRIGLSIHYEKWFCIVNNKCQLDLDFGLGWKSEKIEQYSVAKFDNKFSKPFNVC